MQRKESIVLPQIAIRVGENNAVLNHFLQLNQSTTWMIITAWYPNEAVPSKNQNDVLLQEIRSRGLVAIPMWGCADALDWPAEPSYLVLNVARNDVQDWLNRYAQNACVFGEYNTKCIPELVWQRNVNPSISMQRAYESTTYQSASLLLHHPTLCQTWLRACGARRISMGEMSPEKIAQEDVVLQLPFSSKQTLCFWSA